MNIVLKEFPLATDNGGSRSRGWGGQVRGRCRGHTEGIFTAFDWSQAPVLPLDVASKLQRALRTVSDRQSAGPQL